MSITTNKAVSADARLSVAASAQRTAPGHLHLRFVEYYSDPVCLGAGTV